jgi:cyclophilin family peptidyl-prolyl cis-trans isomerase
MNSFSTKKKKKRNWREELAGGAAAQPSTTSGPSSKFKEWHDRMDGKVQAEAAAAVLPKPRSPTPPPPEPPKPNPQVYFDLQVGGSMQKPEGEWLGRLEIELFADVVPKTAENFRRLCVGGAMSQFCGNGNLPLCFAGNIFHRIIKGFMAQGGDITREDGTGGESIYGRTFEDENFLLQHTRPGMLSMANSGRHSNNSQFFLTFVRTPHLDGKHVVFGRVLGSGLAVLRQLESLAASKDGEPRTEVRIRACGELPPPRETTHHSRAAPRRRSRSRSPRRRSRSRSRSPRRRSRSRSRSRSRNRRSGGGGATSSDWAGGGSGQQSVLQTVRSAAREVSATIAEWEVLVGGWSEGGGAAGRLAAPGGAVERAEVQLTDLLLRLEEGDVDHQQAASLRRYVRELGTRLAKVKAAAV